MFFVLFIYFIFFFLHSTTQRKSLGPPNNIVNLFTRQLHSHPISVPSTLCDLHLRQSLPPSALAMTHRASPSISRRPVTTLFLHFFPPLLIMTYQLQTSVISKRLKLEQRDCAHMKDLLMKFQGLIRFFKLSHREVVLLGFKGAQKINAPLFLNFRKWHIIFKRVSFLNGLSYNNEIALK